MKKFIQKFTGSKDSSSGNSTTASEVPLRLLTLGGGGMATKNLTIYEYEDEILAVDYGIGFPEGDDYGVDYLIPDMTYLLENKHKVKALFISHAHADHFAAVPHLLKQLNIPVYGNKLTLGYLDKMLEEKQNKSLRDNVSFNLIKPGDNIDFLNFKVSTFNVNHSVPGSLGLIIDTPQGKFVHMADYKIDESPILDKPIDVNFLKEIGSSGVTCLLSDCLGSLQKDKVPSEATINETFPKVFSEFKDKQLFITTISSNISRMYQIIDAAAQAGRKVVPTGRSIDQTIQIATDAGYLPFGPDFYLDLKHASEYDQRNIVYLIAGCFGQPGSALSRLSLGEHRDIQLEKGSVLVYSAEPHPPGVDVDVERVNDNMILRGADVIDFHTTEHLHVSGHGHQPSLSTVAKAINPKYFIPIGGTAHQMRGYKNMIGEIGLNKNNVLEMGEGHIVEFLKGQISFKEPLEVKEFIIDGTAINPVVIRDREMLSTEGVLVVIVPMRKDTKEFIGNVDVVTRGFIYVKESRVLMGKTRDFVTKLIEKNNKDKKDWPTLKHSVEKQLKKFLYKQIGRDPLVIVHSIFV